MRFARAALWTCLVFLCAPAFAGTPQRDRAWDALVAQARAHGGVETKLDRSASYVFRRPDGSYLSFTRLLAGARSRSVCLIAENQNATACIDWDTGRLTLGERADAAAPWRFRGFPSLDAFEAQKPGFAQVLLTTIQDLIASGGGFGGQGAPGC